jgi:hypothetical protein
MRRSCPDFRCLAPRGKVHSTTASTSFSSHFEMDAATARMEPADLARMGPWTVRNHSGASTVTLASFSPHLAHRRRARAVSSRPDPQHCANPLADIVRVAPHPRHSMRTLAPNRTTSAMVRMCLVDIPAA